MRGAESTGAQDSGMVTPRSQSDPSRRLVPWGPSEIPITVRPRCGERTNGVTMTTFDVRRRETKPGLASMIFGTTGREPTGAVSAMTRGPLVREPGCAVVTLPIDVRLCDRPEGST